MCIYYLYPDVRWDKIYAIGFVFPLCVNLSVPVLPSYVCVSFVFPLSVFARFYVFRVSFLSVLCSLVVFAGFQVQLSVFFSVFGSRISFQVYLSIFSRFGFFSHVFSASFVLPISFFCVHG